MSERLYGCIEAGGTKFIAGIIATPSDIRETTRIATTNPEDTIGAAEEWLHAAIGRHGGICALGIASFGPIETDTTKPNWGYITRTTKAGWSETDFAARLRRIFGVPVGFDTDVNGAALSEARWGTAQSQSVSVYVTVGTGIGGGTIVNHVPLRGLSHSEMGHLYPRRHADDLTFAGICPFHGDCLEGLASGPAIKARWGMSLSELPADHFGHNVIAFYLGQLVSTLQSIMEPGRIIFGGGVMNTPGLLAKVSEAADRLSAGYFRGQPSKIIVPPGLGDQTGLLGAFALAQKALAQQDLI